MNFENNIHYSTNFERAILGICLMEKDAFARIYGVVDKETFYHDSHQVVFETLKTMFEQSIPIDILTVIDQLFRFKGLKEINGTNTDYFITSLTNDIVSSAHLEYHCHVVKTMWTEREIIKLTHSGQPKGDVRKQIYELQTKLQSLQSKNTEDEWQDMSELMVKLYQHQEEIKKTGGVGIATGINTIDRENGGFQPGQMIVIGARPSVGKSALAGMIALDMAAKGKRVGIISLEMSNTEIAARLASIDTQTDFHVLYRGLYRDEHQTQVVYKRIASTTSQLPIHVTDKTDVNMSEIKAKAQKLKAKHGLDCLMIDYLQLVEAGESYNRSRENEIAKISRSCKVMAKDMNIPVILLCQLNREVTKRKGIDRYPQLSDLRESGSIEQDADVVMFLHRDYMNGLEVDEQGNSTENQADLVVRKWRNGKTNFIIPMDFDAPKMKFVERKQSHFIPVSQGHHDDNPF